MDRGLTGFLLSCTIVINVLGECNMMVLTRKKIADFRAGLYGHTHETGKDMGNGRTYFSKADNSIPTKFGKPIWCRICLRKNPDELWCFEKRFRICATYCDEECFSYASKFEDHMQYSENLNKKLDAIRKSRLCLA